MIEALTYSLSGMQSASLNVAKAADNIANPSSGSELVEDVVTLIAGEQNFKANATALGITKDMQEDLYRAVDIKV